MRISHILLASAASVLLAACVGQPADNTSIGAQTATVGEASVSPVAPAEASRPQLGSFGFDVAGMDRNAAPGDNFFRFANGNWAAKTEIPADRSSFGMFTVLDELSDQRTRDIIETAAKSNAPAGSEQQKIGDYFASFMDEAAIEVRGLTPLKPELDAIAAIGTKADLARVMAELGRTYTSVPFGFYVNQDIKAPDSYIPVFVQGGLGLPDRDYYLVDNPKFVDVRGKYVQHIANMLRMAGVPNAEGKAKNIYELERQMAHVHWTRVDSRDDDKTYNKRERTAFAKFAPGFDWNAYFTAAGLGDQSAFIVSQPSAFTGMAKLASSIPLQTWRDYLTFHALSGHADLLPKAFVDEDFAFYGRTLSGTPELKERWKRGVDLVNQGLGEAVGKLYVEKYFPPEAKAKADELVRNLIAAMDDRLSKLEWMAPETKAKARAKLAAFTPKIGYPDTWRDYSALQIAPGDLFGNAKRAAEFEYLRNLNKLGKPVDRGEWFMTPMTINAYANPPMNEIVFPAAILQPPFFDPNADPAINYGGIGAVIGHEISHHFDDQGRKYDQTGRLTDWWTPADVERFKTYTDQLVAQYNQYEPLPGMKLNGALTLGENIADLAGLTVAHEAYRLSLKGQPSPVLDGFTGDQRFFLGWAQVWRTKYREETLRQLIVVDPHSPGEQRASVVRNLDAWYTAFDPQPGQALYLAPEKRVKIW